MMETSSLRIQVLFAAAAFLLLGIWAATFAFVQDPGFFGYYLFLLYSSTCFATALAFLFSSFPTSGSYGRISMLTSLISCSVMIGLSTAAIILGYSEAVGLILVNLFVACYGSFLVYHLKNHDAVGVRVIR